MNDENLDKNVEETKDAVSETASEAVSNEPPIKVADSAPEATPVPEVSEEPKEEVSEAAPEETAGEKVFESTPEAPKEEAAPEVAVEEEKKEEAPVETPTEEPTETPGEEGELKKAGGKGKIVVPAIAILILAAAAVGFIFLSKNPKTVFHKFFTTVQSNVKSNEYLNSENKIKGQTEFTISSDLEGFDSVFTDKKQTITYGFDANKHTLEFGVAGESADNTGLVAFVKDGHTYLKLNKADKTTLLDNSESFGQYAQLLNSVVNSNTISNQDLVYLIDKTISLIDTSMMDGKYSKGKETVTINKSKVRLNKYTYKIDKDVLVTQGNKVLKGLKEDKKAKEIINGLLKSQNMTLDDIPEIKSDDIGDMNAINFSIFTKGIQAVFAGIKFEVDKNAFTYAINGEEFVITSTGDDGSLNVSSVKKGSNNVVTAVIKNKEGKDQGKLEATVKTLTKEKLDLDYKLSLGGQAITGTLNVTGNDKASKFNATVKLEENTITLKGTSKAVNGEVANYSTSTTDMNDLEIMYYGVNELQGTYLANFIALQTAQAAAQAGEQASVPTP